jgi:CDP-paratose 2-epimerase
MNLGRALIWTLYPAPGGVHAMARQALGFLRERCSEVSLAYYVPYRVDGSLSVPSWGVLTRSPRSREFVDDEGTLCHEVGVRLPELEWARYLQQGPWKPLIDRYDHHVVVSGNILPALPILRAGRPCMAWIASQYFGDKKDRLKNYPPARRIFDRLFETPVGLALERFALGKCHVIALSDYTRAELLHCRKSARIARMPMPVSTSAGRPKTALRGRIGFSGRYDDPRKHTELLIEALAICRRETGLDLTLHLVGGTPSADTLELARSLGIAGSIVFEGHRQPSELGEFYDSIDVFAIPSHQEGLAIVGLGHGLGLPDRVHPLRGAGGVRPVRGERLPQRPRCPRVRWSPRDNSHRRTYVSEDERGGPSDRQDALRRERRERGLLAGIRQRVWNLKEYRPVTRRILITGGAGFIGSNASLRFARDGWDVTILDNLSRGGGEKNLDWLRGEGARFRFERVDVRNDGEVQRVFREGGFDTVLHLAAQVAVTTSVVDPREDFEINAIGTFNVLEAMRRHAPSAFLVYSSTNKVYGKMEGVAVAERNGRYEYVDLARGADEHQPLDFHSPYGCSKGAADQYVLDYGRIYGLRTSAFRQSCIYGERQFGIEDQGWVAWFIIAAIAGRQLTVYGDGKQIRDVLYVGDLVDAYIAAIGRQDQAAGQAFNVGGGPENTLSLLELIRDLEGELGLKITPKFDDWRPGDQPVFVCDLSKIGRCLGWKPRTSVREGVRLLISWVSRNRDLFPAP